MSYEPNLKSVRKHKVPDWFHDAKLGIFIHWGIYSVPAFAPTEESISETMKKDQAYHFKNNPYAEWYLNTMKIKDSPTQKHHNKVYGKDFSYFNFIQEFNQDIKRWDPNKMADLFKKIGTRYVILVTKHHDGFLLWPSKYPNPKRKDHFATRNIVGELTKAVKKIGMRMGFYYSGGLDWTFNEAPIQDFLSFVTNGPIDPEYNEYIKNHFIELIDLYEPSIIWNDIGYPPEANLYEVIAYFYNKIPDGLVNDRWFQITKKMRDLIRDNLDRFTQAAKEISGEGASVDVLKPPHYDFRTPEYATYHKIKKDKFESCRGIGYSFGFNREEGEKEHISVDELVRMFIDIVSKNGNLLLNVGPMADGVIPEMQVERLLGLGNWLETNGEAIFGTRPWIRAEGKTDDDIDVRFTQKENILYAILLDNPKSGKIIIKSLQVDTNAEIYLLDYKEKLGWEQIGEDLAITIPKKIKPAPAHAFKIFPKPLLENI